jgi:hypothetical protein
MREALSERAEEKMKLPVKLFLKPYLPHFYLGYARFERGDCPGALEAWAESERQGVSTRLPDFDVARRGRKTCEDRSRQQAMGRAREEAQRALTRSTQVGEALLARSRDAQARAYWSQGDPAPSSRHDRAMESLGRASELLDDAGVDARGIERAEALIEEADETFAELDAGLDRYSEATRLDLAARATSIDARVAQAKAALAETAYLAPYPSAVRKARTDLGELVAEAQRRDNASRAQLDGLAARLERSIAELAKHTAKPPERLAKAVDAYLEGRHADVVADLESAKFTARRARAHARLLLAASRHALYLEGGELDDEMRAAAADDARASHQEDEALAPTPRFFSPRFVTFFNESIAAAAAPSG